MLYNDALISIILLKVCSAPALQWWELICIVYGGFRVFEIIIYQINLILFYRYRGVLENLANYTRSIVHIIQNYAETIFWFALFYRNLEWAFDTKGISLNHVFTSLKLSFSTMTNFTPTEISPLGALANIFTFSQSVIGLTMTLLVLTWFISLLPKPGTLDEREETDNI